MQLPPTLVQVREKGTPLLFGYGRVPPDEKAESWGRQYESILREAKVLAEAGRGILPEPEFQVVIKWRSAEEIPYSERAEFKRLLDLMQSGDLLIVCRPEYLDRDPRRFIEATQHFAENGIDLYLTYYSHDRGTELRVGTLPGVAPGLSALAQEFARMMHNHFAELHVSKQEARARGGHPGGHLEIGKRFEGHGKQRKVVWDKEQCEIIAELVDRRRGQSYLEIHTAFEQARYKRPDGRSWAPYTGFWRKPRKLAGGRTVCNIGKKLIRPDLDFLQRVYVKFEEHLAENHGVIGGLVPYKSDLRPNYRPRSGGTTSAAEAASKE